MRSRHLVQNLYSSQLADQMPGIWLTGDRLDVFTFDAVTPPVTDTGWYFIEFEDPTRRDLIYSHARTGSKLSYYRMNRDLLNNGSKNLTHWKDASIRMNDVGEWMNYISQNIEDFWTIEQWGDGLNVIKVYGGKISYNMTTATVSDTILTLADGTWQIVFDYITGTITNVATITDPWLWIATVVVASSTISSIVDVRGTAQVDEFSPTFFDVASWTLIIAAGSIGTNQIADNSITDAKLTATWVTPWSYWNLWSYPVFTVDAKWRLTSAWQQALPTGNLSYVYTQWAPSSTWNINHGLNSEDMVFSVFDTSDQAIVPLTFTVIDANNVTITFSWPTDGKAVLTIVWWLSAWAAWGTITGTLSDQTDLQNALDAKQDDLPLTTAGDMLIRNALNADDRLPLGSTNRVLQSNGTIPAYGTFMKVGTTAAMAWVSLAHADADATTTSVVSWTASAVPNGFIEVVLSAGTITFNSTVAETVSFTYSLIKA